MTLVNGYCTVAQLRDHLGDPGPTLSTNLLERAISAASRAVDTYCDRRFWQDAAVTQRIYNPTNCRQTFTDDISTRTGLIIELGSDGVTFPTALASTDYTLRPPNGGVVAGADTADAYAFWEVVALNTLFTVDSYRPTVRVTARFGWSAIPSVVEEATILKATSLFKRKDAPFGVAGFGEFGAVRITRADPDVIDLLSPPYQKLGL